MPVANAADYIFGYTIQIDVSDRGGRGDRKMGGSDWLVGKNHDTFGPLGPFIVPKEFVKDPMNTRHTFTLNGQVMQDSNTNRMRSQHLRAAALRVEHPDAEPGRRHLGRQPGGHQHRARRAALDAGGRHGRVRDRGHRHAEARRRRRERVDELTVGLDGLDGLEGLDGRDRRSGGSGR